MFGQRVRVQPHGGVPGGRRQLRPSVSPRRNQRRGGRSSSRSSCPRLYRLLVRMIRRAPTTSTTSFRGCPPRRCWSSSVATSMLLSIPTLCPLCSRRTCLQLRRCASSQQLLPSGRWRTLRSSLFPWLSSRRRRWWSSGSNYSRLPVYPDHGQQPTRPSSGRCVGDVSSVASSIRSL